MIVHKSGSVPPARESVPAGAPEGNGPNHFSEVVLTEKLEPDAPFMPLGVEQALAQQIEIRVAPPALGRPPFQLIMLPHRSSHFASGYVVFITESGTRLAVGWSG